MQETHYGVINECAQDLYNHLNQEWNSSHFFGIGLQITVVPGFIKLFTMRVSSRI